jgi:hypothetical protein
MSETVNVANEQEMYSRFFDIYPELKGKCCGFRVFHWSDRLKKILINVKGSRMQILFSVRKDEDTDTWDQFSALLIPAPNENAVEA